MFSGSYDKSVRAWDVHSLECRGTCSGHSGAVRALVASRRHVYSGSDDATIKVCADACMHAFVHMCKRARKRAALHFWSACAFLRQRGRAAGGRMLLVSKASRQRGH